MRATRRFRVLMGLAGAAVLMGTGCNDQAPEQRVKGYRQAPQNVPEAPAAPRQPSQPTPEGERPRFGGSNTKQGQDVADQLMLASGGLLADARVEDDTKLTVVLGPKAEAEVVPDLLRALVLIMSEHFPDNDIAVQVLDQQRRPMVSASLDASEGMVTYSVP